MAEISPDTFRTQIAGLTARLAGHPLDAALDDGAHRPTVSEGRALVLVLLPDGQIRFS